MTFYEQMVPALSILLEIGETLKAPIYAGGEKCRMSRRFQSRRDIFA